MRRAVLIALLAACGPAEPEDRAGGCALVAAEVCAVGAECGGASDQERCQRYVRAWCCGDYRGCAEEPLDWPACEASLADLTCDSVRTSAWLGELAACFAEE